MMMLPLLLLLLLLINSQSSHLYLIFYTITLSYLTSSYSPTLYIRFLEQIFEISQDLSF